MPQLLTMVHSWARADLLMTQGPVRRLRRNPRDYSSGFASRLGCTHRVSGREALRLRWRTAWQGYGDARVDAHPEVWCHAEGR